MQTITPNADQQVALDKIQSWLKSDSRTFALGGLAGTGKSSIIPLMFDLCPELSIRVATPTGKAASVLNQKFGRKVAATIHSLAYAPLGNTKSNRKDFLGRDEYEPVFEETHYDAPLTIVDEASMIDANVYNRLLDAPGNRYLFVGDHGQLPPVKGVDISPALRHRDHTLTEIVRQAKDSPIRELAYEVRSGAPLTTPTRGIEVIQRTPSLQFVAEHAHEHDTDMLICATNKVRNTLNHITRSLRGLPASDLVTEGDRIILTSNNKSHQVYNGEQYEVTKVHRRSNKFDEGPSIVADITDGITKHERLVLGFQWRTHVCYDQGHIGCDFGYALTAHKAQGSQADNVSIIAENIGWMGNHAPAWRYTSVTRAAKDLTIFSSS